MLVLILYCIVLFCVMSWLMYGRLAITECAESESYKILELHGVAVFLRREYEECAFLSLQHKHDLLFCCQRILLSVQDV